MEFRLHCWLFLTNLRRSSPRVKVNFNGSLVFQSSFVPVSLFKRKLRNFPCISSGSVRQLLHEKIRDAYIHPQFISDVMKPLLIEDIIDQEVQNLSGNECRVDTFHNNILLIESIHFLFQRPISFHTTEIAATDMHRSFHCVDLFVLTKLSFHQAVSCNVSP